MILGGDEAVCLLLSAHRAVIIAIAQLSCFQARGPCLKSGACYKPTCETFCTWKIDLHLTRALAITVISARQSAIFRLKQRIQRPNGPNIYDLDEITLSAAALQVV